MPRALNLSQFLVADDVQRVREWLGKVEKRAARNRLRDADLTRLSKVALALSGKSKPTLGTLRARAVRVIADWLALGTTDTSPLLANLVRIDGAFATLQPNRADRDALTGATGAKRQREHTLAARLSLRAGALGCRKSDSPDAAAIEAKRRLFRKATD